MTLNVEENRAARSKQELQELPLEYDKCRSCPHPTDLDHSLDEGSSVLLSFTERGMTRNSEADTHDVLNTNSS